MYRHVKEYEIKYTDTDAYDHLKPSSLMSFMEESACLSADELGFGYDVIMPKKIGFIIVNWYVELYRPVKLGEKLEVHTWPLRPKHLVFLRDFELYSGGEKVGVCSTRWCMINLENFTMLPVAHFFEEGFFDNYNTERSVDFAGWKIPAIPDGELAFSRKVAYSDYDHYFHVNNTKYADYLMDTFTPEELEGKFIKKLQVTYTKQCKLGETIDLYKKTEGNICIVEGKVGDEQRVQFKVEIDEI